MANLPKNDAFRRDDLFHDENTVRVCTRALSLVLGLGGVGFLFSSVTKSFSLPLRCSINYFLCKGPSFKVLHYSVLTILGNLSKSTKRQPLSQRGCSWSGWFHTLLGENRLNIAYSRWCARCIHLRGSERCYHHILRCQDHYVLRVMEQEAGLRSSLLGSGGRETDLCVSEKKSAVESLFTLRLRDRESFGRRRGGK